MEQTAVELQQLIENIKPILLQISNEEATEKPNIERWSKKEILGHLLDSAANNHQKFTRTMAQSEVEFVGYEQNTWVNSQHYQSRLWEEIVEFWSNYNLHLAHIIENVPVEYLSNTIKIDGIGPFRLDFIIPDYVEHLKHHLAQILPFADLKSKFKNVYH